ncbi:Transmembrane protein [Hirschfeldia incana]|nr:Transmembrane protein [Hirschfeldia incana]
MSIAGGGKWLREAEQLVVKPFRLVTTTLLSLLLPLSFLLLSRLSLASFLFSLIKSPPQTESSFFFSIFHYTYPAILYVAVSAISVYTLVIGLTTKITATDPNRSIPFYPHVTMAWLTLFLVQISVGLGLEGTSSNGSIIGSERNFLSRLVFFCGLYEVMLLWCRLIVRPVVDSTLIFGQHRREETVVERVALAVSCGTFWWWKLRDEVEALVGVAEAKRALLLLLLPTDGNVNVSMDVGVVDFVNWWLYYIVVTIGMVRMVKGSLWFGVILLFEQVSRRNPREISTTDPISTDSSVHYDDEGDTKV